MARPPGLAAVNFTPFPGCSTFLPHTDRYNVCHLHVRLVVAYLTNSAQINSLCVLLASNQLNYDIDLFLPLLPPMAECRYCFANPATPWVS
jgi:hypothetical protein